MDKIIVPDLSIIIPHYNHTKYIDECVLSVLNSTTRFSWEIIIVDDGSTEAGVSENLERIKHLDNRVSILFQQNGGQGKARNAGIKTASGDYILTLDSDNYIHPDFIETCIGKLKEDKTIDVCYSNAFFTGEKSGIMNQAKFNMQRMMLNNYIDNCMFFKKNVWENVGGYDESEVMRSLEDWDFNLRIGFQRYKFHFIHQPLFYYRVLGNSSSGTFKKDKSKINKVLEYLEHKYPEQISRDSIDNLLISKVKRNPFSYLLRIILNSYTPSVIKFLYHKNRIRKNLI